MQLTYLALHRSPTVVAVSRLILPADYADAMDARWAELRAHLASSCHIGLTDPILPRSVPDRLRPSTRRRAIASALTTIAGLGGMGIETSTLWARTTPVREAGDLAALVDRTLTAIDLELQIDQLRGLAIISAAAPIPAGRRYHRLIESPIVKPLTGSAGLEIADLVAWTGLHHALVADLPGFPWQPYDSLKSVDRWGFPIDVDIDDLEDAHP